MAINPAIWTANETSTDQICYELAQAINGRTWQDGLLTDLTGGATAALRYDPLEQLLGMQDSLIVTTPVNFIAERQTRVAQEQSHDVAIIARRRLDKNFVYEEEMQRQWLFTRQLVDLQFLGNIPASLVVSPIGAEPQDVDIDTKDVPIAQSVVQVTYRELRG